MLTGIKLRRNKLLGDFTDCHTLAIDSRGNIYVAESGFGRRIQKSKRSRHAGRFVVR
jgi:hypothetical protein